MSFFDVGDEAKSMLLLHSGEVAYYRISGSILEPPIAKNEAVSEAALCTSWTRLGKLVAVAESTLTAVDVEKFGQAMHMNLEAWNMAAKYARMVVEDINETIPNDLTDVIRTEDFYESVHMNLSFSGLPGAGTGFTFGVSSSDLTSWGKSRASTRNTQLARPSRTARFASRKPSPEDQAQPGATSRRDSADATGSQQTADSRASFSSPWAKGHPRSANRHSTDSEATEISSAGFTG